MFDKMDKDDWLAGYYKTMIANNILNRIWPSEDARLNSELAKLSIIEKKKTLGIPLTDDAYEDSVNEELSFDKARIPMAVAASQIKKSTVRSKALPDLRFFDKPTDMTIHAKNPSPLPLLDILMGKKSSLPVPKWDLEDIIKMAARKRI